MNALIVRQLIEPDAAAFGALRLDALQTNPEAFGSTYDAEKATTTAEFATWLSRGYVAGAFVDDALVGMAGFYAMTGKQAHIGKLWGVFVKPQNRGAGAARALIEHVLAHARQNVLQVHLSAVTDNASAVALYTRLGFSIYGTEPRALRIGDRFFDEHLMVNRLDAGPAD